MMMAMLADQADNGDSTKNIFLGVSGWWAFSFWSLFLMFRTSWRKSKYNFDCEYSISAGRALIISIIELVYTEKTFFGGAACTMPILCLVLFAQCNSDCEYSISTGVNVLRIRIWPSLVGLSVPSQSILRLVLFAQGYIPSFVLLGHGWYFTFPKHFFILHIYSLPFHSSNPQLRFLPVYFSACMPACLLARSTRKEETTINTIK